MTEEDDEMSLCDQCGQERPDTETCECGMQVCFDCRIGAHHEECEGEQE